MKLSQILSQVTIKYKLQNLDSIAQIEIEDIAIDSRLVKKNSAFFALAGKETDGSKFIDSALKSGAAFVIAKDVNSEIPAIKCDDVFGLLVEFLKVFYSPIPARIYAITGTNGKTSTAEFTRQILQFLGKKSASIGTLGVMCADEIKAHLQNSSLTTPDIVSLYKNLKVLKEFGVDDVAIEVSSIGLEQRRIAGLKVAVGAFTNFTQDHLDYHKSMEEYFRCKTILFDSVLENGSCAVLNSDIAEFPKLQKICQDKKHKVIQYGFNASDLKLLTIEQNNLGQKVEFEFQEKKYDFELSVSGEFQAFNALCALGIVLSENYFDLENLLKEFPNLNPAPGRMQRAGILENGAQIFIDFAHSPDALQNVLKLAREISKGRVIVLFGCGGNRDAAKRPLMGKIASDLADLVIVTDDNPRHEKAENIRAEILAACDMEKTIEIAGRERAIEEAVKMLWDFDTLILAGKGHEKYQIMGNEKFEFDEEKIVKNAIAAIS